MGEPDAARVDVAALLGVARGYEAAADVVDGAVRTHLTYLSFDGAAAAVRTADTLTALRENLRHAVDGRSLRRWPSMTAARAGAPIGSPPPRPWQPLLEIAPRPAS